MRTVGTVSRGVRLPVIREKDDLKSIVCKYLDLMIEDQNVKVQDRDVIGITESLVARAEGNFVDFDDIKTDIDFKFHGVKTLGLVFPILSRNRFLNILKAIAGSVENLVIQLSYPADEVGNALISQEALDNSGVNPYSDSFTEEEFKKIFGESFKHPFTGCDYVELYKNVSNNIKIVFSNDPKYILNYSKNIICADIHTRKRTQQILKQDNAGIVLTLDAIMNYPIEFSGYNTKYGLLGSNYAGEGKLKLFPEYGQQLVNYVQQYFKEKYNKTVEVLIYGDGAFKDPQGKIWELADPVVSPAFTSGLIGLPAELKFKLIADTEIRSERNADDEMKRYIKSHKANLQTGELGTTPRQLTDLLGSLCDLMSGSGDKGTPVIYIQGYFDDYSKE